MLGEFNRRGTGRNGHFKGIAGQLGEEARTCGDKFQIQSDHIRFGSLDVVDRQWTETGRKRPKKEISVIQRFAS